MASNEIMQRLQGDMKAAMKGREKERLNTIRMLISSLKNRQIELGRDLTDDDVIETLSTEAKRRREAADQYREGDRPELANQEEAELEVVQQYLPQQFDDQEVRTMIEDIKTETGASSRKDMGKVMGQLMPRLTGRFDGSRARELVMEALA